MKIHVKNRFGVIPNHILSDARLSWKAKWLWVYIQSKPDDWDFSSERISREAPDGRDSTRSGLRELERFGFLIRTRYNWEKWQWWYEWELNDEGNNYNKPIQVNTATANPPTENPSTENPSINKEGITKQELQNNTDTERDEKNILESDIEIIETKTLERKTPREYAIEFFGMEEDRLLSAFDFDTTAENFPLILQEIRKFRSYWTEPTPNGKKQLWETKPTFEVRRRLATWFGNLKGFRKTDTREGRVAGGFKIFE